MVWVALVLVWSANLIALLLWGLLFAPMVLRSVWARSRVR